MTNANPATPLITKLVYLLAIVVITATIIISIGSFASTTKCIYQQYSMLKPQDRPAATLFDPERNRGYKRYLPNRILKAVGVPPLRPLSQFLALKLLEGKPESDTSSVMKR